MTQDQIHELINVLSAKEGTNCLLIETHISWVLLSSEFAFKIKKPLRFNFLDFSTLALRKHFCEEEIKLNRRLTDIYLGTVPVTRHQGKLGLDTQGEIVDYAVKMKRLEPERQMHLLLEKDAVKVADVEALAAMIATFHRQAITINRPFDAKSTLEDFADILSVAPFLNGRLDKNLAHLMEAWVNLATNTIQQFSRRFSQRVEEGFIKDGHGDLHSGNIFLLEKPVIFDCIEFNSHFRENDVLSELAFLAMDLEQFGRSDLKEILMEKYQEILPCILCPDDEVIFQYYLLYRASVRLKISALKWKGLLEEGGGKTADEEQPIRLLINLCVKYAEQLQRMVQV